MGPRAYRGIVCALGLAALCVAGRAAPDDKWAWLADPAFVRARQPTDDPMPTPEARRLGCETPVHDNGVYGVRDLNRSSLYADHWRVEGTNWLRVLCERPSDTLTTAHRAVATSFAQRWAPQFWRLPVPKRLFVDEPGPAGVGSLEWRLADDSANQSWLRVAIRVPDGAVVGFGHMGIVLEQTGALSSDRIKAIAIEHVRRTAVPAFDEVVVRHWVSGRPDYQVYLDCRRGPHQRRRAEVWVDGTNGKVRHEHVSEPEQPWRDEPARLDDTEPTYTSAGLAFLSTRRLSV